MTQKNSHKNTKDAIQIYTDGSCLKNPYGPGGYAAIIRYQSDGKQYEMRLSGGAAGTTNNRMELMAVIEAVKHCPDIEKPMLVYTDSQYIVNAFGKGWIKNWVRLNWDRGKEGGPVKNADLWKKLLTVIGKRKIDFAWVKGHAGNPLNEQCDKMAVEAAKTLKGTYKKGTVKQENKADKTQKEQPSLSFVVSKVNAADLDLHKMLEENKKYLLIPSAAYFPQTRSGKYTVLMDYCGTRKVISGDCEEHDPNGVFLRGIFEACCLLRLKKKKIVILCGNAVGFSRPQKSVHKDIFQQIDRSTKMLGNQIQVIEINGGMKKIKQIIKAYS